MAEELPAVLSVEDLGEGRFSAPHPADDPEGRDVVFSGQLLAQMIMASCAAGGATKEVKSIHTIFARAGTYSAGPMDLRVETIHAGRAWGSDTVTASQGERLLSRGLVLLNTVEPDLVRHGPEMPDVPGPDDLAVDPAKITFPGTEARSVDWPDATADDGTPALYSWVRHQESFDSIAANQAVLAWDQPGSLIGLALRPHADVVKISDAHVSISTSVISHTTHFHEHFDVGEWLLIAQTATYAGRGRVFGSGRVFRADGTLVSTFAQDSMARGVEGTLDRSRGM
jgi:acyl-CoA thioesterase-2